METYITGHNGRNFPPNEVLGMPKDRLQHRDAAKGADEGPRPDDVVRAFRRWCCTITNPARSQGRPASKSMLAHGGQQELQTLDKADCHWWSYMRSKLMAGFSFLRYSRLLRYVRRCSTTNRRFDAVYGIFILRRGAINAIWRSPDVEYIGDDTAHVTIVTKTIDIRVLT